MLHVRVRQPAQERRLVEVRQTPRLLGVRDVRERGAARARPSDPGEERRAVERLVVLHDGLLALQPMGGGGG